MIRRTLIICSLILATRALFLPGDCTEGICGNGTCYEVPLMFAGPDYQLEYYCSCPENRKGASCERTCDLKCGDGLKCVYNEIRQPICVCQDCDRTNKTVAVSCPDGYSGYNCTVRDWCYPNSCLNGGICHGQGDSAKCVCPEGLQGSRCEEDIDECDLSHGSICFNGDCVNTFGSHKCKCHEGFTGAWCGRVISPAYKEITRDYPYCVFGVDDNGKGSMRRCENGAACRFGPANITGKCECPVGFEGELCERKIDFCGHNPCFNGGSCFNDEDKADGYRCLCMGGYVGEFCETKIDHCLNNDCAANTTARCVNGPGRFECECKEGWMGSRCEIRDVCSTKPCLHGKCFQGDSGDFDCICEQGYEGIFCDVDVNECDQKNMCANGGECINTQGGWHCECSRGFAGIICEDVLDTCENFTCHNDGRCVPEEKTNEPFCSCLPGFIGRHCETKCPVGYVGDSCDIPIDEPQCRRNRDCRNGGECVDGLCWCPYTHIGRHCETLRRDVRKNGPTCEDSSCQNNSTCVPVDTNDDGFVCICQSGWEGVDCDKRKNLCEVNPCYNGGRCLSSENDVACKCPIGFKGRFCEEQVPFDCQLKAKQCLNGGKCEHGACKCPAGYAGIRCDEQVDMELAYIESKEKLMAKVCESRNCSALAGNGACDLMCNFGACAFDGGDCDESRQPFAKCPFAAYCATAFANKKCDQACNTADCLFDGFDCQAQVPRCPLAISKYCASVYADGKCDSECDSIDCGFDGGDCEVAQNVTTLSDVRFTVGVGAREFLHEMKNFLMRLSHELRAVVRIQRDDEGFLIFEVVDGEIGQRIAVKTTDTEISSSEGLRSRHRRATSTSSVVVFLQVDVPKTSSSEVSFADAQGVVNFVSADLAKKGDNAFGLPVREALVAKPDRRSQTPTMNIILFGCVGVVIVGLIVGVVVTSSGEGGTSRKRRIVSAPVWMPPAEMDLKQQQHAFSTSQTSLINPHISNGMFFDAKRQRIENNYSMGYHHSFGHHNAIYNMQAQVSPVEFNYPKTEQPQNGLVPGAPVIPKPVVKNYNPAPELHWQAASDVAISIELNSGNVNEKDDENRRSVIHWLCANSTGKPEELIVEEVRRVIEVGADVNSRDKEGNTPIMLAVRGRRLRLTRILLSAGADPTIFNNSERTALHEAVLNLDYKMAEILLTNPKMIDDIDEVDRNAKTALMDAARREYGSTRIAGLLISKGAKIDCDGSSRKDSPIFTGRTALHYAAQVNNLTMIKYFLSVGANRDKQDERGETPMMLAAKEGHLATVKILVENGASIGTTDQMDQTASQFASKGCHWAVAEYLNNMEKKSEHTICDKAEKKHSMPNGRPTIKAVKRQAKRKNASSRDAHLTPPHSDGFLSSPSPPNFVAAPTFSSSTSSSLHSSNADSSPEYHPQDVDTMNCTTSSHHGRMWFESSSPPYDGVQPTQIPFTNMAYEQQHLLHNNIQPPTFYY